MFVGSDRDLDIDASFLNHAHIGCLHIYYVAKIVDDFRFSYVCVSEKTGKILTESIT